MRPKNPRDLSQPDLAGLVEILQNILYWDKDRHCWNADKEHGSETWADIEDLMADAGLVPRRVGPAGRAREINAFPEVAGLRLLTAYVEGECYLLSLKLRTVVAEGADLECDESVPHVDLTEPFGEDDSIEGAAAREAGLDPTEGFPGWDAIFDFLEKHDELLSR